MRIKTSRHRAFMAIAAGVITMLAASVSAGGADYKHEETVIKSIPLEQAESIIVESLSGDIAISGEDGREAIELKIVKSVRAEDEESARKIAESMGVVVTRPAGAIRIETRYPKKGKVKKSIFSFFVERGHSMNIELTLVVPPGMAVETATASGDVEISHILSDVEVSSASGDVEIRDISGDVNASAASGRIRAADIGGAAALSSAAGDIEARNIGGDAEISVATGNAELTSIGGRLELSTYTGDSMVDGVGAVKYEGISGSAKFLDVRGAVEASAASGDLIFRVTPEGVNDYRLTASSGNVVLRFIRTINDGYILKAATTSGEISARLPITVTKVDRNMIAGIVRDGRAKVFLETASGNITIEEPEE
jgi:DUF4097 and DUF4098 domain-containing protein YvlB